MASVCVLLRSKRPRAAPAHTQGACRPPAPRAVVRRSGDGQWRQRFPRCCWCCPGLSWGGMGDSPCILARSLGLRRHRAAPTHPRPHADRQPRALSCRAMALEMAPRWAYCPSDATQGRRGVRVGHWRVLHAAYTTWEVPRSATSRRMRPRHVKIGALLVDSYFPLMGQIAR